MSIRVFRFVFRVPICWHPQLLNSWTNCSLCVGCQIMCTLIWVVRSFRKSVKITFYDGVVQVANVPLTIRLATPKLNVIMGLCGKPSACVSNHNVCLSNRGKVFCQMYFMPRVHRAPPLMPPRTNCSSASTGGRLVGKLCPHGCCGQVLCF